MDEHPIKKTLLVNLRIENKTFDKLPKNNLILTKNARLS